MCIYFLMMILSSLFMYFSCKQICGIKNRRKMIIYFVLAIAVPAFIAGLRSSTVGYDTTLYVKPLFIRARESNSLWEYMTYTYIVNHNINIGYSAFVYLIAFFFQNEHWLYFFTSIIIFFLFALGVKNEISFLNITPFETGIVWFILLLLTFNNSLNLSRQFIAIAIVLYSKKYIYNKSFWKYFLCCFVAFLFHSSAIAFLVLFPMYWLIEKKNGILWMFTINLGVVIFLAFYQNILSYIGDIVPAFQTYTSSKYVNGFHFSSPDNKLTLFLLLCVTIIFVIKLAKYSVNKKHIYYYSLMTAVTALFMLGNSNSDSYRIAYYLVPYIPVIIIYYNRVFKKRERNVINLLFCMISLYYWYYLFILNGFADTYPYVSDILGI